MDGHRTACEQGGVMEKDKYNLIFKGEIIEGAIIEDVKKKLASLFKKDAASAHINWSRR